jgi:hypothetical protein
MSASGGRVDHRRAGPRHARSFLLGLALCSFLNLSATLGGEFASGWVLLAAFACIVVYLTAIRTQAEHVVQVFQQAYWVGFGLFAPLIFGAIVELVSEGHAAWRFVVATAGALPIVLALIAILAARMFVWCRIPRRLM